MTYPTIPAGGWNRYSDRNTLDKRIYFRSTDRNTVTATIKAGQVIKQRSFLESDSTAKLIAHTGLQEAAVVQFGTLAAGATIVLGGTTFTAGSSSVTPAQLVSVWAGITAGTTGPTNAYGTFSGNLTGWNCTSFYQLVTQPNYTYLTPQFSDLDCVVFSSTTALTNVTDLADSGNGSATTIAKVQGATAFNKIAGVAMFDVNASSADTLTTIYTKASFWEFALCWAVNPNEDVMVNGDGTTTAYTAYNTGCVGNPLMKLKFVEHSNFTNLGFETAGDVVTASTLGY